MKNMTKRISAMGLVLGAVLGVIAGAFLGSWILWLGLGVSIGLAAGTVRARRLRGDPGKHLEARL